MRTRSCLLTTLLLTTVLAACGSPAALPPATATSAPSPSAVLTATATLGPTAAPSLTPSPTPARTLPPSMTPTATHTPVPTPDFLALIAEHIRVFLAAEEPYTDHDIQMTMFAPMGFRGERLPGILSFQEDIGFIQGLLLGFLPAEDGIVLFLGTYNREAQRFVIPVKIYTALYFDEYPVSRLRGNAFNFSGNENSLVPFNELPLLLYSNLGHAMAVQLTLKSTPLDQIPEEGRANAREHGQDPDEFFTRMANLTDQTIPPGKRLLGSLWRPRSADSNLLSVLARIEDRAPIPPVVTVEDLAQVMASDEPLPWAVALCYWVY